MSIFLRSLRILAMVVWVGGLIFFAFVVAPVAFYLLPSKHEAGIVVGGTLRVLNQMGMVCYAIFFIATTQHARIKAKQLRPRILGSQLVLVTLMFLATLWVNANIVPAMERDRIAAGGDIDAASKDNPARVDFERLHPISEKLEGAALFLGLGVVLLMAAEDRHHPSHVEFEE